MFEIARNVGVIGHTPEKRGNKKTKQITRFPNQVAFSQDWFSEFYQTQRARTAWCNLQKGGAGEIKGLV